MLGPSGSGKTTVLRLIAGLRAPDRRVGSCSASEDVTDLPPYRPRREHRLPGLRDLPAHERRCRTSSTACGSRRSTARRASRARRGGARRRSGSRGTTTRRPTQLSGGQRQRVALARALVNRPKVLLLDEPLGALDLKLRREMQVELKEIQRDVGITFVFVTHDQEEALTMSDRIAVFNEGRIEQVATPVELYEQPGQRRSSPASSAPRTCSSGDAAQRASSARDGTFAVRPGEAARRDRAGALGRRRRAARRPGGCARSSTSAPARTPSSSSTPAPR